MATEQSLDTRAESADAVLAVLGELLGIANPSPEDDFFEIGGHSLAAIRLIARLRRQLRVELSAEEVLATPKLDDLITLIDRRRRSAPDALVENELRAVRSDSHELAPLTPIQERLWFMQQLAPDVIAYNFQARLRFEGDLDEEALRSALDAIVERHEIFRTSFPTIDGVPRQEVHAPFSAPLTVVDLRATGDPEQIERAAERFIADAVRETFDIRDVPLVRWCLVKHGDTSASLVHVEHHLIHDGWSFGVFMSELGRLYRAFHDGVDSHLPPLPQQFADYVREYRDWLEPRVEEQVAYWTKSLEGVPRLALPPAEDARPFSGELARVPMPGVLARRVRAASSQLAVTRYAICFSAFAVWLRNRTAQDDFAIGMSLANRPTPESELLLGCFINNVAIRVRVDDREPFASLARDVQAAFSGAIANAHAPFQDIVRELGERRDPATNPIFQASFDFHDAPFPALDWQDVTVEVEEGIDNGSAKFPIDVVVVPEISRRSSTGRRDRDEMELHWRTGGALAGPGTAAAQAVTFLDTLATLLDSPTVPIRELMAGTGHPDEAATTASQSESLVAEAVADVFRTVLELDEVQQSDNFFELGGHSLLAVQVVAGLNELLGIELPIRAIFEAQTPEALAAYAATSTDGRLGA